MRSTITNDASHANLIDKEIIFDFECLYNDAILLDAFDYSMLD